MKNNELRIRNLVEYKGKICEVKYLGTSDVGLSYNKTSKHENYGASYRKEISPIPLTEYWLDKFGFECAWSGQGDGTTYRLSTIDLHTHNINNGWNFQWEWLKYNSHDPDKFAYPNINIKHVHSLQNLVFSLTGEELTIKE